MENLAYDIVETSREIRRDFDKRAAALGVNRAQWRVLAKLRRQDGLRQIELADALDVEPITIGRMIDRLAEAGLVERRADATDRRAWRIFLTPEAAPVVAKLRRVADRMFADAFAGMDEGELDVLRSLLARVRDNLDERGESAARRAS